MPARVRARVPSPLVALLAAVASAPLPPLAELAARFAPVIVQETRPQGRNRTQDLPVPFDFDGNWEMTDNWAHQPAFAPDARPTVYWAAASTERFTYLTYLLFYPRDWASLCLPFVCHENDLEQFTVVVEAGADEPLLMDVKFHRGQKAYPRPDLRAPPRDETRGRLTTMGVPPPPKLSDRTHNLDNPMISDVYRKAPPDCLPGVRPLVRVESGGHGILSCDTDGDGRLDAGCVDPESAMVLAPDEETAIPPGVAQGAEVRAYELQPLATTLWPRRAAKHPTWAGRALAYVGRRLGRVGAPMGMAFAGSGPDGGARAPWGVRPKDGLEAGDRFLDPALAIGRRWKLPGGPDESPYVIHPMLDELRRECEGPACAP